MALPDYFKVDSLNSLTSGISSQAIADGSSYTGSAIDNTTNRYPYLAVEAVWSYGTAPTANKTVEFHLLHALDSTNYEDMSSKTLIGAISPDADTSTHRQVIRTAVPLVADSFKLAVKNVDTGQQITITVNAYGYYESIED